MSVSILTNRVLMVILSLTLALFCMSVELAAQVLPPNNCGNVFRYERWGFGWIGIVVPEYNGLTRMDWTLKFAAHGSGSSGQVSQLALYPDKTTAYQHMFQGGRAECYVTFQNYGSELPKIIYADLNGQVLCTANGYGAPSSTMTRSLKVSVSTNQVAGPPLPTAPPTYKVRITQAPVTVRPPSVQSVPIANKWKDNIFLNNAVSSAASSGSSSSGGFGGSTSSGFVSSSGTTSGGTTNIFHTSGLFDGGSFFSSSWPTTTFVSNGNWPSTTFVSSGNWPSTTFGSSGSRPSSNSGGTASRPSSNSGGNGSSPSSNLGSSGSRPSSNSGGTASRPSSNSGGPRTPVVSSNGSSGNTDITVASSGGSGGAKPIITVNTGTRDENPATDKCGMEGLVGLLIGGETLPHGRFPWMAALYHDDDPDPKKLSLTYKCVATLISSRTVVTAAHCIWEKQPEEMRVYVGRHDLDTHPETGATLMEIQSAFTHPDFVGNLVPDSDIGLLIFTTHVQESNYVRAICMWTSSTLLSNGGVEDATIGGWGNDENGKPTRFPKAAVVQTVSRETCLREMVSAKDFLTPRTLCAGNKKAHGPCLGDSGAGLMIQRNGRWMLRAIVSLAQRSGDTCDLTKYVIYSDVAAHLRWIESKIVR
ncbi:spermosin-like [Scaptodrosophila lebanonensis]|uniref:Spermosin-like n=1 Tax=Drosophila lebanonensis TaxID=7225 RepID=A0A6J2T338_DROLE|nr:spermosin-like [Scaptodrosophila lebanonensis]